MLVTIKKLTMVGIFSILIAMWAGYYGVALAAENNTAPEPNKDATSAKPAKIFFPQRNYSFEPVMEGTKIKHDFIVENHGEGVLEIKGIRPD